MWKNNRPDGWVTGDDLTIQQIREMTKNEMFEAGADAMLKEILIELQRIYNLPDEGMFNKKLGEFIQELMEEVR